MKNVKFSYMKNLNLNGYNNIQMSVFTVLSLTICITDKQFLHFQCQLLKLAKYKQAVRCLTKERNTRIIKNNYCSDQLPFLRSVLNVGNKATKEYTVLKRFQLSLSVGFPSQCRHLHIVPFLSYVLTRSRCWLSK